MVFIPTLPCSVLLVVSFTYHQACDADSVSPLSLHAVFAEEAIIDDERPLVLLQVGAVAGLPVQSHDESRSRLQANVNGSHASHIRNVPVEDLGAPESPQSFAAVMEIDANNAGDLYALLINIASCASMCVGCFMLMSWLRLRFPLTYENNVAIGIAPFTPAKTFLGWVSASLQCTTHEAQKAAGLDMAMLIQFHEMCIWLMVLIGIPFVIVYSPLHYFKGGDKAREDRLSKIAMGNDQDKVLVWWAVAIGTWYVFAVVHFVLFSWQKAFIARRFQWLKDMPEPRSSTVLVTGIPLAYCTDKRLEDYFNQMFGDHVVEEAFIVKHTRPLRTLIDQRDEAQHNLDVAKATWDKDKKDKAKQPTVWKGWGFVDAIDHYTGEVQRLQGMVKEERADLKKRAAAVGERFVGTSPAVEDVEMDESGHPIDPAHIRAALSMLGDSIEPNTTNGFVTFKSRHHQAMAVQMQFRSDDTEFSCTVPPDSAEVLYSSFMLDDDSAQLYHMIGFGWIVAIFLLYMPFVVRISMATNIHRIAEYNEHAAYFVENYPDLATAYDGMMGSIGIEIFMCFLPTVLAQIFNTFWTPHAPSYLQVYMQNWYFFFLLTFVLLITGLGNSLYDRLAQFTRSPLSVLDTFFSTMPSTSHFYMNYVVLNTVTQGMVLTRYVPLLKYIGWRAIFPEEQARLKSEPEDPDYYGIGSRSARFTLMLSICLVFSSISPLILILGLIYFSWTRVIYGYLLVFAECRKADLGGVFWGQQIKHIHMVLWVYGILMSGVCTARGPVWQCGLLPLGALVLHVKLCSRFEHMFKWQFLPFEANVAISDTIMKRKAEIFHWRSKEAGGRKHYQQSELVDD